ncbi:MAG: hypothetical protein QOH91_4626 [Mycobacterium sp.]|nr:hypothetical protein [Mycobacterium sp.]
MPPSPTPSQASPPTILHRGFGRVSVLETGAISSCLKSASAGLADCNAVRRGLTHHQRVESEYRRHGAPAYLAAYDVHRAHVIGHCAPSTGIEPFTALVDKVMTRQPYSSARRVFFVVERRITPRLDRSSAAHRCVSQRDHDPPAGTRVLAQPDIHFSVLQRKRLTPDDFPDLDVLANRLTAFEARYNTAADHSTGASTATTSPDSSPESPHNPRRTNGRAPLGCLTSSPFNIRRGRVGLRPRGARCCGCRFRWHSIRCVSVSTFS